MADFSEVTKWFNLGLVGLFLLVVVGVILACFNGLRKGVWKSTHNLLIMLILIILAFATLDPLVKIAETFNLTVFIQGSFYISRTVDGEVMTYFVPITNVKDTLCEFIKGFYTLYNVSATPESAANFVLAISESALKIVIFVVDMILIVTLGNLFSFLMWFLVGKHLVPKVLRKKAKLRFVGMAETAVTFILVLFLFFTPFTSLLNSVNQSYQRNRPNSNDKMITEVGNFVDAYNNSLFANVLFNWTVDQSGMTLDTRLFNQFTTGVSGDVTIGLVQELANLTNLGMIFTSGISGVSESEFSYDPANLITKEVVNSTFDVLTKSALLTNILPLAVDITLNSEMLDGFIPNRLVDLSDVDWKNELSYVQEMINCVFDSGVLDNLTIYDEYGNKTFRSFEGNDLVTFIESIVYDENFDSILDVFRSIDKSKVLSKVVPAVAKVFIDMDKEGKVKEYLPLSWEQICEVSWGYECYVLFDFLHATVTLDPQFLRSIFVQTGIYKPAEGETIPALATLISQNVDGFVELLVGKTNDAGELVNVDSAGHTIAFSNGQRIPDTHYCLFDMELIEMLLPNFLDKLFEMDGLKDVMKDLSEEDIEPFHQAVRGLNNGHVLTNYKKEFKAILDVVATVGKDTELLEALMSEKGFASLMKEEGNFFSIDVKHVKIFQSAIAKMDRSNLLYSALTPFLKSLLSSEDVASTFNDIGLKSSVVVSAITHDMRRENHTLFNTFSNLLDGWEDINALMSIASGEDSNAMMEKLKDDSIIESLVNVLDLLLENELFNPTPEAGDTYEKNENLYGLLEFVFSMTEDIGITIDRATLKEVETHKTWHDEFVAIANIFKYIANHDVLNASTVLENGLTAEAISNLKDDGPGHIYIPGLFASIDQSYIFTRVLGPFVDDLFGDALSGFVVDKSINVSFSNITNWTKEGQTIAELLESISAFVPESGSFDNFDISKIHEIVDLNKMLHDLSNSGIFYYVDENGTSHYQFGAWLYNKVESYMSNFDVDNTDSYDLLADPKPGELSTWSWDPAWGNRPSDPGTTDKYFQEWEDKYNADGSAANTHYIAYRDFVNIKGLESDDPALQTTWCNYDEFMARQNKFLITDNHQADLTNPATYLNNDWGAYFASDQFLEDYNDVFDVDEISRVVRFITYAMRVMEPDKNGNTLAINKLDSNFLDGFLTSINETHCLRISIYNFYNIATNNIFNGYGAFSLETAYSVYMVDAEYDIFDFTHARPARQAELDRLTTFYTFIDDVSDTLFDGSGNVDFKKLTDTTFVNKMKDALKTLNNSYVFHRAGSAVTGKQTTFQGMFNHMLADSDMKDVIYSDNSPKDIALTANGTYSKTTKVSYLIDNAFLTDADAIAKSLNPDEENVNQNKEIDNLLDAIKELYSLKNSGGEAVTSLNDVDMNNADNIDVVETLLKALNKSKLLYDCVPNAIYNLFVGNPALSISVGDDSVEFNRVDPYYHYYFDGNEQRVAPNYEVSYADADIESITSLMETYQNLNASLSGGNLSNPTLLSGLAGEGGALRPLLVTLHDSRIFHSPARNYTGGSYYTNKFDDNGYTLFEEMVAKVCSFVKLDTFAYDDAFASDHAYGNAAAKLRNRIKAITAADDFGSGTTIYHNAQDSAWTGSGQEIDAILNIAKVASNLTTSGTLDLSSFQFDALDPTQIKNLLCAVNGSDLVCDAVPCFIDTGFNSIGLRSLTTYDAVDYAYYRIGQLAFGGADNLAGEGTEINEIYQIMSSLRDGDHYMTGFAGTSLSEFLTNQGEEKFTGLIRYVYKSHILNTSQSGVYAQLNTVDGKAVSAQGVLLNQLLGGDLREYIAKDADSATPVRADLDKISILSQIVNFNAHGENSYLVEATALNTLIEKTSGTITASTFASGDINDIKNNATLKQTILDVIETSYNPTGEHKRSFITSEFISGVLNTILQNEYTKLTNDHPTYAYRTYSFGNDDPATINVHSYDDLNEVEYNGFDGMIGLLNYVDNLMTLSASDREGMVACFAKMGLTPGNNSKVAQAIYLAEGHDKFKLLGLVPYHGHTFTPVDETSTDATNDMSVYGNNFCFKDYGESVDYYLS